MASHASHVGPEGGLEGEGISLAAGPGEDTLSSETIDGPPEIWSICLTHADKFDRALVETWKGDMDGILIFSGLFSAVVTAFLIDSYKSLQPDPASVNANLTAQVAIILARSVNSSDLVLPQMPSPNSQTANLTINALWFFSLVFSLLCALAATLVQQWSRIYLQGTTERFNPHQRVRMRTYLQQGVQRFRLNEMVDAIPMLLHVALFLFFGGLLVFLFNLNTTLARIVLVLIIPALSIYTLLTALPVFFYDCPYKTPLTSVLSYITYAMAVYRPRRQRYGRKAMLKQWHPEQQTTRLTALWARDGSKQGAELDHTALRWTFLALTGPNDLELFVGSLPGLLQPDSGSNFARDGGHAAQALLFGPDMLAENVMWLLHSAIPSDALALAPADRRRLDARAVTCLSTISLLARACDGPTSSAPQLWAAWAARYSNPVARDALALSAHPHPTIATLARSTALLITWRTLVTYRTFLADIGQRAAIAAAAPASMLYSRYLSELRERLSAGSYLARSLGEVLQGVVGDPGSGVSGGAPVLQRGEELLRRGELRPYMSSTALRGTVTDADLTELARVARADMCRAKTCLAVLFMHAACSLPANAAGREALHALAAPLPWPEACEYDDPDAAMGLLLSLRHAHGHDTLTVLDADEVVALYQSIHTPRRQRADPPDASVVGSPSSYMHSRRRGTGRSWGQGSWRQGTM